MALPNHRIPLPAELDTTHELGIKAISTTPTWHLARAGEDLAEIAAKFITSALKCSEWRTVWDW